MMAHTFRGSGWKSVLGLESSQTVFRRYKAIRDRERRYLDWPDPVEKKDSAARVLHPRPLVAQS
jgi:hypothetical protein